MSGLLTSELNISKTEFKAYLECPFKFYMIKDLNQNQPPGPRGRRDYSRFSKESQEGMKWHYWFMDFFSNYAERIMLDQPPSEGETAEDTKIINLFYQQELVRYKQNPQNWLPFKVEWYLQNEIYRGTIDRVDMLNKAGDCRIVEYKRRKGVYDEQEVLFYAYLLTKDLPVYENNQLIRKVTEVAVYYYQTGELWSKKIAEADLAVLEKFLVVVREEIMTPNWVKKDECSPRNTHCIYREVCERILL
jgi:hypothetical protein